MRTASTSIHTEKGRHVALVIAAAAHDADDLRTLLHAVGLLGDADTFRHGTQYAYRRRKCRCPKCRTWLDTHAAHERARRRKRSRKRSAA